ncbi:MAG: 3-oxoacid CoA-transferase subunit B [Alphaproteobacteria bacterium]
MNASVTPLDRNQMAWRCAQDVADGSYVNLGIGIPTLVGNFIPGGREVMLQSENGLLGIGPAATGNRIDPDLVDAGGQKVTLLPGASIFDSALAFTMMRGGHIDLTVLGGFQVSEGGDLANWDAMMESRGPLVGGAMDLAAGAKQVWVVMEHVTREGAARLVRTCTYPLTARAVVTRVYTSLAVVDVTREGFLVRELVEGLTEADLRRTSDAPLAFAPDCATLRAPVLS